MVICNLFDDLLHECANYCAWKDSKEGNYHLYPEGAKV